MSTSKPTDMKALIDRKILELEFTGYSRIVNQKHGFSVLQEITESQFDVSQLSDNDLLRLVGLLKDMAHLPPA